MWGVKAQVRHTVKYLHEIFLYAKEHHGKGETWRAFVRDLGTNT